MKQTASILILIFILIGCTSKPIRTQNFEGEVSINSLVVNFENIDIIDDDNDSLIGKVKKAQKLLQEISDFTNSNKSALLNQQLVEFQEILIERLRARSGLPLVLTPDATPKLVYGSSAELSKIEFNYPAVSGPALDMQATVKYSKITSLEAGAVNDIIGTRRLSVVPVLNVVVRGKNTARDLFWRDSYAYKSTERYYIANNYVLGVSTDRIDDGQIFLIPLAKEL